MKFASWSVIATFVGGIGFGLLAFRQRYRSALAEVDRQRLEGDAESERLRLRLATVTQSNSDGRSDDPPDDLKAIKGIGPVIDKALTDIGVCRYEQIAAFTPADIDRVSEALGSLARRIERDDWVGGARRILETRAGEDRQQR